MIFTSVSIVLVLPHVASGASTRLPRALSGSTAPQPEFACTNNDFDWIGDEYNHEHCQAALQRLYNVDVARYGGLEYEFLPPEAENQTAKLPMQTPRRYTVGKGSFESSTGSITDNKTSRSMYSRNCDDDLLPRGCIAWRRSFGPILLQGYRSDILRRPVARR
jgi:hypothetical protein